MSKLINSLKTLNTHISQEAKEIQVFLEDRKHKYNSDVFIHIDSFRINDSAGIPKTKQDMSGVYIFRMIRDSEKFDMKQFNDVNNATQLKKDSVLSMNFVCGDILYVGKSEGELVERINQHITFDGTEKTYALKLSSPNRCFLLNTCVEVIYFQLTSEYSNYQKAILPAVERYLHSLLKPKIGSAKTT